MQMKTEATHTHLNTCAHELRANAGWHHVQLATFWWMKWKICIFFNLTLQLLNVSILAQLTHAA